MSKASDTIELAQSFLGDDIEFTELHQVYELQSLLAPVIAYKILLEIAINAEDAKERRLAAAKLLDASTEAPERIANRLRESMFKDLTLEQLQAIIQTGQTNPAKALEMFKNVN